MVGGSELLPCAGTSGLRRGVEKFLQVRMVPTFPHPTLQHHPFLSIPKGAVSNALGHLPFQSGLLCSCHARCRVRRARALAQSGLLVRVAGVGAWCLAGDTEAGRDGTGLPPGQDNLRILFFPPRPFLLPTTLPHPGKETFM